MASKITYWACTDCGSMINDENMHESPHTHVGVYRIHRKNAEFCYGCMSYNPEVVIAYR